MSPVTSAISRYAFGRKRDTSILKSVQDAVSAGAIVPQFAFHRAAPLRSGINLSMRSPRDRRNRNVRRTSSRLDCQDDVRYARDESRRVAVVININETNEAGLSLNTDRYREMHRSDEMPPQLSDAGIACA